MACGYSRRRRGLSRGTVCLYIVALVVEFWTRLHFIYRFAKDDHSVLFTITFYFLNYSYTHIKCFPLRACDCGNIWQYFTMLLANPGPIPIRLSAAVEIASCTNGSWLRHNYTYIVYRGRRIDRLAAGCGVRVTAALTFLRNLCTPSDDY